ncbi:hypothetical protein NYE69_33545, partial [Paenibacillus sp. FSL R5-0527]|uniref:hypothetical protein n=1 Tax=Paenibacillus sp. FSL R5-0527 TaxID=2975321 RepID=UPI0030F95A98
ANERYFNGLISNFTSLNVGQGKGVSAALASFSPTSDGFTVTVNFANSNSGTTFNASIDYWVAIE